MIKLLLIIHVLMLPSSATAFTAQGVVLYHSRCLNKDHGASSSSLNLVPISEAWDTTQEEPSQSSSFASILPNLGCKSFNSEGMLIHSSGEEKNKRYRLYLATNFDDLPPIAQLTIDVFDATAITLSSTSTEWSAFEQAMVGAVVEPVIGMYNAYAQAVGYTEVLSGLRKRMRNRLVLNNQNVNNEEENDGGDGNCYDWLAPLVVPNDDDNVNDSTNTLESIAAQSSLILALARPIPTSTTSGEEMEVVASIELRLQPTDAKIPFSQPWLDKIERKLAHALPFAMMKEDDDNNESTLKPNTTTDNSINNAPLRPYLCNLCVAPKLRSLGIGRALCRIVETIAKEKWGYPHIYLHVDPTNDAALTLYEKEGYVDVGKRWNVLWAGGANEISYYVKSL